MTTNTSPPTESRSRRRGRPTGTTRIPWTLWRLEAAWRDNPELELRDLLRKLSGNGQIPTDRTLRKRLAAYSLYDDEERD